MWAYLISMEKYLIDTDVLSVLIKRRPNDNVLKWFNSKHSTNLYVSVLTIGELCRGAENIAIRDPARAQKINSWIDGIEKEYADRLLPVDLAIATRWGLLTSDRSRPLADTLLAATALEHGLTLATRNTKDVEDTGVSLENPFTYHG